MYMILMNILQTGDWLLLILLDKVGKEKHEFTNLNSQLK